MTAIRPVVSVIDDDESVRDSLVGLVRSIGLEVRSFECAPAFLASPSLEETACVIADVHMPHMTGPELHEQLVGQGRAIPTILITAYPDDHVRARALADGVLCYLAKPLDDDALIGCVRSALA